MTWTWAMESRMECATWCLQTRNARHFMFLVFHVSKVFGIHTVELMTIKLPNVTVRNGNAKARLWYWPWAAPLLAWENHEKRLWMEIQTIQHHRSSTNPFILCHVSLGGFVLIAYPSSMQHFQRWIHQRKQIAKPQLPTVTPLGQTMSERVARRSSDKDPHKASFGQTSAGQKKGASSTHKEALPPFTAEWWRLPGVKHISYTLIMFDICGSGLDQVIFDLSQSRIKKRMQNWC